MKEKLDQKEKLFIRLPFSVYFGWITVATIANITTLLVDIGWNGFGILRVDLDNSYHHYRASNRSRHDDPQP